MQRPVQVFEGDGEATPEYLRAEAAQQLDTILRNLQIWCQESLTVRNLDLYKRNHFTQVDVICDALRRHVLSPARELAPINQEIAAKCAYNLGLAIAGATRNVEIIAEGHTACALITAMLDKNIGKKP